METTPLAYSLSIPHDCALADMQTAFDHEPSQGKVVHCRHHIFTAFKEEFIMERPSFVDDSNVHCLFDYVWCTMREMSRSIFSVDGAFAFHSATPQTLICSLARQSLLKARHHRDQYSVQFPSATT